MVNMTLSVPDKMKKEMDGYPWVNWSEIARMAFRERLEDLRILEDFRSESELTDEEAIKLGKEFNRSLYRRYRERK